jgi:hypothetical protein
MVNRFIGIKRGMAQMNGWPKSWKLLENDLLALILLTVAVVLAAVDRIAGASLVAGLFVAFVLLRTLPQMKSFKGMGFEAQWRETVQTSETAALDLRTELSHLKDEFKAISVRTDLPSEVIPALKRVNSTFQIAEDKITVVQNANTKLEALFNEAASPNICNSVGGTANRPMDLEKK